MPRTQLIKNKNMIKNLLKVVRLVGEHMSGKVCLSPLHLTQPNIPLEQIALVLKKRQVSFKLTPQQKGSFSNFILRSQ